MRGCEETSRNRDCILTHGNPGVAFREVKGKLYPSIGLKKNGEHIRANFGQTPFVYDIDGMMEAEIERINRDISGTRLVMITLLPLSAC